MTISVQMITQTYLVASIFVPVFTLISFKLRPLFPTLINNKLLI